MTLLLAALLTACAILAIPAGRKVQITRRGNR